MPRKLNSKPTKRATKPVKSRRSPRQLVSEYKNELRLLLAAAVLLFAGVWLHQVGQDKSTASAVGDDGVSRLISRDIRSKLDATKKDIAQLENDQASSGVRAVDSQVIQQQLTLVSMDLRSQNLRKARHDLQDLRTKTTDWQDQVRKAIAAKPTPTPKPVYSPSEVAAAFVPSLYLNVPILMYHDTPGDFENQLLALRNKGYTVIDMDQLASAMAKATTLPDKSVVITFDDGYADQMQAYNLLSKYGMKAIFYIIDAGEASRWCIGAGRRYNDPLQPAGGCGDGYLTWDQVRQLDASGLITIGAHTVNHRNLAALSADDQRFEIADGKTQLEAQLGHPVRHLAYPYGGYNQTSINIAREAGFTTAVTTISGTYQAFGSQYTLHRERSAYNLP